MSLQTLNFMWQTIVTKNKTGAIAPSSKALAEAICVKAGVREANVIVEFGSGTGVFTEEILRRKRPDAYFMAMEINPSLAKATRERCPSALVHVDGAQSAAKYLQRAGHEQCDTIISGLPWSVFNDDLQDEILNATYESLCPGGRFVTFIYFMSPLLPSGRTFLKEKLPARFPVIRTSEVIWRNFPPCRLYIAEKA